MDSDRESSSRLRKLLRRLVDLQNHPREDSDAELSAVMDEIHSLPRDGLLPALDQAVDQSKTLRNAAVFVLCEFSDLPEALDRIIQELQNPEWRVRDLVLQTIGFCRLERLAPLLNRVMLEDPDENCRSSAIWAAGRLKQDINFPVILQMAELGYPNLEVVLTAYNREEGRPYLRRIFNSPIGETPSVDELGDVFNIEAQRKANTWSSKKVSKIHAAWGLAKLGDVEALEHLGVMLYDQDFSGRNFSFPGESLRAAQALADLYDLPFNGTTDDLEPIRRWWQENRDRLVKEAS